MDPKSPGTRRYLYEYLFHQAVETTKASLDKPVMISQARRVRALVDAKLAQAGTTMDDSSLDLPTVLGAIEDAMSESVSGYRPVFEPRGSASPAYKQMVGRFSDMFGLAHDGRRASTGQAGPRIPISPYDPRWAGRATVKRVGSRLTHVLDHDVEQLAGGQVARLHRLQTEDLALHVVDDEGRAVEAGRALTVDDLSGMSELMSRMSPEEYNDVRGWVAQMATTPEGMVDRRRFMSAEAVARSAALLDELREQGVAYTVVRDREPGQIAARIEGTKISVRLTDRHENESFVGRVYDDGMAVYFTTNLKRDDHRTQAYTPSAAEAVQLLRVAQGQPVDRPDGRGQVGRAGTHTEAAWSRSQGRRVPVEIQDSYYVRDDKAAMTWFDDLRVDGREVPGASVFIRRDARHRTAPATYFGQPEAAEQFISASVASARESVVEQLDVDSLVAAAAEHAGEEGYAPELSGDSEIAAIQRSYWDVLTGRRDTLLRPGATVEDYDDATDVLAELDMGDAQRQATIDMLAGRFAYTGTPEERVRAHAAEVADGMVGTAEAREVVDEEGVHAIKRFDPARVAKYMASEHGAWRNTSDLVAALRTAQIDPEELMGDGYGARQVKDRMISFDESSAMTREELPDGVRARMMDVVRDSLERGGARVGPVLIDANGIISWQAQRLDRTGNPLQSSAQAGPEILRGQIGQIFETGEHGEVVTRFASGENYTLVPGYEARLAAQRPGEDLSVEERTVLRGYEQVMAEAIQYRVAADLMVMRSETGEPTSVNGVYRRLYDERLPEDFLERADERGLGRGWAGAVLDTLSGRVRYPDSMGDTFYQSWQRSRGNDGADPSNDNFSSAIVLTGGRNMAVLSEEGDGYFDPDMTNASHMGTTRYLVAGATVDPATGRISPSPVEGDCAAVMSHPDTEFMRYNSWDRRQMISSVLLHATSVTDPEPVLMSDVLKGWTADDGRVVSKAYAERNQMLSRDGSSRPLVVGDKDSDLHGNKGVIGLIVDPDMDPAEARAQGIEDAVALFRDNPGLSVVMSPFSGVSRFNGGTAREMMQDVRDAVMPDGTTVPGAIGTMRFVITNKDVEAGTRVYDDTALAAGRGRRASAQLAWALGAQGADRVMGEFYGPNGSAAANLREYLVTTGLDLSPEGELLDGYQEATASERRLFGMPELARAQNGRLNIGAMRRQFAGVVGDRGGDLEMPFPLRFPTGAQIPATDSGTYRLPVLSSHLRTGQELDDGTSVAHDYTNQYLAVYEQACGYRFAAEELERDDLSDAARARLEAKLVSAPQQAQAAFDQIVKGVKDRQFSGKRNIFKEGLMSSRLPNSATAVWTADPRLDIDQLGVSPALAEGLGVTDDDHLLVWRDPVLRDGGARYLRVRVDERLTGVSIHPAMDKSFDGDFDGDSVGIVRLSGEGARRQAHELLSVEANLVDLGHMEEVSVDGDRMELYPLAMQDSLDTKVSQHFAPELAERFAALTMRANEIHTDLAEGEIERDEALRQGRALVRDLSDYYHEALSPEQGSVALRFDSTESHMRSMVAACVETGAKGSMSKIGDYARHFGADPSTYADLGGPQQTRAEDEGVQVAVTVKTAVGIAGAYSQRGVKALRNQELKAVTELTYPVTQSQLQAKHDPAEAMQKYGMLMGPARALWRGQKLERANGPQGPTWAPVREKHAEVQATPEEWKAQFVEMYTSRDGLNVSINPDYVDSVAAALTDPSTGRMVDMEDPTSARVQGRGSTLDRLAYGGTFEDVLACAKNGERLFDGRQDAAFAPFAVRRNLREREDYALRMERRADDTRPVEGPEIEQIVVRDVLADSDERARARGGARRSARARAVSAARPAAPEAEEASAKDDDPSMGM